MEQAPALGMEAHLTEVRHLWGTAAADTVRVHTVQVHHIRMAGAPTHHTRPRRKNTRCLRFCWLPQLLQ